MKKELKSTALRSSVNGTATNQEMIASCSYCKIVLVPCIKSKHTRTLYIPV